MTPFTRRLGPLVALCLLAAAAPDRPMLTAKTLDGQTFSLAALHGDVVLVNFWASWCAPCRVEMPALDRYYRAHRGQGLAMIAIATDQGASPAKLRNETKGYAFPIARLADAKLPRDAIPGALPETRIYDRAGMLRYDSAAAGGKPLDQATLDRVIGPLLAR